MTRGNFFGEGKGWIRGGWRRWRGKKKRCGVSAAGPEAQGTTASLADSLAHFFSLALAVWPTTLLGCRQPLTPPPPLAAGWRLADAAQHCIAGEGRRPPSLPLHLHLRVKPKQHFSLLSAHRQPPLFPLCLLWSLYIHDIPPSAGLTLQHKGLDCKCGTFLHFYCRWIKLEILWQN